MLYCDKKSEFYFRNKNLVLRHLKPKVHVLPFQNKHLAYIRSVAVIQFSLLLATYVRVYETTLLLASGRLDFFAQRPTSPPRACAHIAALPL